MATKVKVNFKHPTVMMTQEKYDSYMKEYEKLLQENKDLRVQVGHLRDDLAKSESESSQDMNAMVKFWEEAVNEKNKAEERAEEYHIALMESDCRVDECEKRIKWLQNERQLYENNVARLTNERDTAVNENTKLMFDINELQDKLEVERNLRVEAEKTYDKVASEAYDMHQQITNLTIDNTRLKNKVEELEAEVDTCHHNIDGYIEGNRRMRAEYEKKLETEQDQTKHWHKKYDDLKENYDELIQLHREWGEEIDRLRKKIVDLQNSRSLINEVHEMLYKYLTTVNTSPSTGTLDF